ncbi:MAG: hypothetical protein EXR95_00505 [Gemmatimonadetes bacterium]|nr:hypothetical protein [Gemmatimonadota bacterium]
MRRVPSRLAAAILLALAAVGPFGAQAQQRPHGADHAHGNQVFGQGVEIIGHEFTREMLASGAVSQRTSTANE